MAVLKNLSLNKGLTFGRKCCAIKKILERETGGGFRRDRTYGRGTHNIVEQLSNCILFYMSQYCTIISSIIIIQKKTKLEYTKCLDS